jgi:hypothetical protein
VTRPDRWWGIRHIRYYLLVWKLARWWNREGHLLGAHINESDLDYLEAVRNGKA